MSLEPRQGARRRGPPRAAGLVAHVMQEAARAFLSGHLGADKIGGRPFLLCQVAGRLFFHFTRGNTMHVSAVRHGWTVFARPSTFPNIVIDRPPSPAAPAAWSRPPPPSPPLLTVVGGGEWQPRPHAHIALCLLVCRSVFHLTLPLPLPPSIQRWTVGTRGVYVRASICHARPRVRETRRLRCHQGSQTGQRRPLPFLSRVLSGPPRTPSPATASPFPVLPGRRIGR